MASKIITMTSLTIAVVLGRAIAVNAQQNGGGGGGEDQTRKNSVRAHSTIMGFTFAFLFPMGSIVIRLVPFHGLTWIHAGIQIFAYCLALIGLGLGVYIAIGPDSLLTGGNGHAIIGIIVVGLLLLQPLLGLIHHYIYKKQGGRTVWATLHVWWGRVIVTLGIINGGLGLMLSENTTKGEIAYGIIAGVIWLLWVAVSIFASVKTRGGEVGETGEKIHRKGKVPVSDYSPERHEENMRA